MKYFLLFLSLSLSERDFYFKMTHLFHSALICQATQTHLNLFNHWLILCYRLLYRHNVPSMRLLVCGNVVLAFRQTSVISEMMFSLAVPINRHYITAAAILTLSEDLLEMLGYKGGWYKCASMTKLSVFCLRFNKINLRFHFWHPRQIIQVHRMV